MSKQTSLQQNSKGLVSVMVAIFLVLIISLVVVNYSKLVRREQRQVLDTQLNTQAFYVAETAVNDAQRAFVADSTLLSGDDYTECTGPDSFINNAGLSAKSELDGPGISYTCLLVDPTPTSWEASVDGSARVVPIEDRAGGNITAVTIAWQANNGGSDFTSCPSIGDLPPGNSWGCGAPMLRVDLVDTSTLSRDSLNTNVREHFFQPQNSNTNAATVVSFADLNGGPTGVNCNNTSSPRYCQVRIEGLNAGSYHLRIRSVYGAASVSVSGYDTNGLVELANAQVVVDATGKATDVLRRIQVRIPLTGNRLSPDGAINSGDSICKRLQVGPSGASPATNEPACQP